MFRICTIFDIVRLQRANASVVPLRFRSGDTTGLRYATKENVIEEMLVDARPAAHWTTQAFGLALISAALLALTTLGLILFGGEDTAFSGLMTAVAVCRDGRGLAIRQGLGAGSRGHGHPWCNGDHVLARVWVVPGVQPYRVHRWSGVPAGSGSVPRRGNHGLVLEEERRYWSNQT